MRFRWRGTVRRKPLGLAQKAMRPGLCMGVYSKQFGYCDRPARPGKLTCQWHHWSERAAQQLERRLRLATH
jgi:hypothetical protein